MNTFNLTLVFDSPEYQKAITLVCASEDHLDTDSIQIVATKAFQQASDAKETLGSTISNMIQAITNECGCSCVKVVSDCIAIFHLKD